VNTSPTASERAAELWNARSCHDPDVGAVQQLQCSNLCVGRGVVDVKDYLAANRAHGGLDRLPHAAKVPGADSVRRVNVVLVLGVPRTR